MSAKKILMLVGDYVEDYEVMVPFQALLMVGHTVQQSVQAKKPVRKLGLLSMTLREIKLTVKSQAITSR